MNKANDKFLTCIEANNCDHQTCIHKGRHKQINARDPLSSPYRPNCVEGAFCYYKNVPVYCISVEQKSGGEEGVMK